MGTASRIWLLPTCSTNPVSIRLGDGLGGFSGSTMSVWIFSPNSVAIGDFNGDGKQDLAVASYGSPGHSLDPPGRWFRRL